MGLNRRYPAVSVERMHFSVPRVVADNMKERSAEQGCKLTAYLTKLMCDFDVWDVVASLDCGKQLVKEAIEKAKECCAKRGVTVNNNFEQTRRVTMGNQSIKDEMVQINLRVTKDQKEQITQKANQMGMSLSGYIIYVATLDMFDITEKLREINAKLDELRLQVDEQQTGDYE